MIRIDNPEQFDVGQNTESRFVDRVPEAGGSAGTERHGRCHSDVRSSPPIRDTIRTTESPTTKLTVPIAIAARPTVTNNTFELRRRW